MKTAGELLREKRISKELTLENIAEKTKIKLEYLAAIESSEFNKLPSATFAKGFLRNYATFLHLNGDTVVAMFRRDFTENKKGEIIPRGFVEPINTKPKFFTVNLILVGVAVFAFLGFLTVQLISWWSYPSLKLIQPQNGDTYGEKVTFKGVTAKEATVKVDDQQVIVDQNGQFTLDIIYPAGTHTILVASTNRQGKTRSLERTFTVSK